MFEFAREGKLEAKAKDKVSKVYCVQTLYIVSVTLAHCNIYTL